MKYSFDTSKISFEYLESKIENTILWENHCHSQYEIIAVLDGYVSIMVEGRSYHLTANQAIIIPPLSYHTVTADKHGIYKRITILFDRSAIPEILQKHLSQNHLSVPIFYSYQLNDLKRVCTSDNLELYKPLAESLMIRIIYECIDSKSTDTLTDIDELLNEIISYIDKHLCEKIKLDDIATHTARSKSSICHLFQEQMKISPKQYILQKKLVLAEKLIHDGTPPTVAAMQIGYNNYSDFYRMYIKHIQRLPSKNTI